MHVFGSGNGVKFGELQFQDQEKTQNISSTADRNWDKSLIYWESPRMHAKSKDVKLSS